MRALALIALVAAAAVAVTPASARVPHRFFGVFGDYPLLSGSGVLDREYNAMVRAGVGSVRDQFIWHAAQPYENWDEVPPEERARFRDEDGVPTDWSTTDAQVRLAAARRMRLMPVIQGAPNWGAKHPGNIASPPSDPAEYARFAAALVRRYGPAGSFWAENPDLPPRPLREWQIWNEPHFVEFWSAQPYERDYVALLRAAHGAIKAVDPRAKVILAGLANRSWEYLPRIYREGARPYFDVLAIHPFTAQTSGVVEILRRNRRVARRFGDARKPLVVTETSWSSGVRKLRESFGWDTTPRGQAAKVEKIFRLLARKRRSLRLRAVFWYTWLSRDENRNYPFDYSGLSRLEQDGDIVRKPAFRAYRRTALRLAGCRRKAGVANRCAR